MTLRAAVAILVLLGVATSTAHAFSVDAKALARYDLSYVKCEAQFPPMRGHRDEAYLNLWRVKPEEKALAQLAAVRKGAVYQTERKRVLHDAAKGSSPPASSPLEQQCQGLWAEHQRAARAGSRR